MAATAAAEAPPPSARPNVPPLSAAAMAAQVREARLARCRDAMDGNAYHAFLMARRYLFGIGVRRIPRTGISWLRVSAAMGHPEAQRLLRYVPRAVGHTPPSCDGGIDGWDRDRLVARAATPPPTAIKDMVARLAPQYGLDPELVLSVIRIESDFRNNVISPKAAAGLMQLIPATAERFGVSDVFDPEDNIRGGMKYLRWLLSYFRGDVELACAGYNAGEGAVDKYNGVPPYAETRNYVFLIRRFYGKERHPYDPGLVDASPAAAKVATRPVVPAKSKS